MSVLPVQTPLDPTGPPARPPARSVPASPSQGRGALSQRALSQRSLSQRSLSQRSLSQRSLSPGAPRRLPDRRPGGHPTARGRATVRGRSVPPSPTVRAARQAVRAGRRPATARVRLTRRGRTVVAAVLCLAVSLTAWSVLSVLPGAGAAAGPSSGAPTPGTPTVVVQPGQTLWQIGHDLAPNSDTRRVVARLERLNHLTDGEVVAGQTLQLR